MNVRISRLLLLNLVTAGLMLSAASAAHAQLRATLVASGFDRPLGLVAHPGTPGVLLVREQAGRAHRPRHEVGRYTVACTSKAG